MGLLRADLLTHSQLEPSGSVFFDGNSDYLSWSNDSVKVGTSDFTLEAWIYAESDTGQHQTIFMAGDSDDAGELVLQWITTGSGSALGSGAPREIGIRVAGTGYYSGQQITFNQWHHVAVVRDGGAITFFLDGEAGKSHTMTENLTTGFTQIGYRDSGYNGYFKGYISNARIALGAIYKNNFTPSKFELKNVSGTLLLCCQSSTSATTAEVVPSAITANGTAAAASFHPDLKKDITDTGVVFDGFGNFSTSTYMVPPSGKTTERNRGRGVVFGGYHPSSGPAGIDGIHYLSIQSMGNAISFGNLSTNSYSGATTCASSTRALKGGGTIGPGSSNPNKTNNIEFVTIATTGNSSDFGDMLDAISFNAGGGNQTRGIWMGGEAPGAPGSSSVNTIQFVTIATAGNAQDFGDLITTLAATAIGASPTRILAMGGGNQNTSPTTRLNTIDYVEIATTGNAQDFGDLTLGKYQGTGVSSNTRAVAMGGVAGPALNNTIDFVTIATTGDATDFGDLSSGTEHTGSVNNATRGVQVGGRFPAYVNTMEFITIATTGNSSDFGDIPMDSLGYIAGASDSHGGLS